MRHGSLYGVLVLLWIGLACASASQVLAQETPVPERYGGATQGYAAQFADVVTELNTFWGGIFADAGLSYRAPFVVTLDGLTATACGPAGPEAFAFYCPTDETIYYSPAAFATHRLRFGDFAPIVVVAHEWGHHVQALLGIVPEPGNAFELQADCLAGTYASEAAQQGLLDPGDVTEAVTTSADAGDPLGLPQDAPGAHGINDDRVIAFMRGYLDGVTGCNLPLASPPLAPVSPATVSRALEPSLSSYLPSTLDLPQAQVFRVEDEGTTSFDDMVAGFPNAQEIRRLLNAWGWEENVYRIYASDDPPSDAVGWLSIGVHRFASADGAAEALPYFATARRDALGFETVDVGLFADQSEAMTGQAVNGEELVIYARRGNLIFRVDGIAPNGDPTDDVFEALLMRLRPLADDPEIVSPELFDVLPEVSSALPGLTLAENHARSAGTVAATFPDVAEAEALFQAWGWRESASRVFTGDTASGTTRVEVSVFQFQDGQAAAEALPYFLDARADALGLEEVTAPAGQGDEVRAITGPVGDDREATAYVRRGRNLFRMTAIGSGDPMRDVAKLLN